MLPTRTAQRYAALLFLGAYVLAGAFSLYHHHDIAIRLSPDEKISAHTCGTVEHHIPLESFHGCEICWQTGQRESPPVEWVVAGRLDAVAEVPGDLHASHLHPASVLLPDKRGPPAVA
jgi:hypothetical protein